MKIRSTLTDISSVTTRSGFSLERVIHKHGQSHPIEHDLSLVSHTNFPRLYLKTAETLNKNVVNSSTFQLHLKVLLFKQTGLFLWNKCRYALVSKDEGIKLETLVFECFYDARSL